MMQTRDITLLTKVHIVKAMVFPVVICGCELLLLLLSHFSHVRLFATPWTVAYQALRSLSVHGIFQARVLEWVAISFSIIPARHIYIYLVGGGDPQKVR